MKCTDFRTGEIICENWGGDWQYLAESIAEYEGYSLTFYRDDGLVICEAFAIVETEKHDRGERFVIDDCISKIDNLNSAVEYVAMQVAQKLLDNENYITTWETP